jgi:iron complex outermembrane receptor protein
MQNNKSGRGNEGVMRTEGLRKLLGPLTAAGVLAGGADLACAAEAAKAGASDGVTIEDVVVTARRREETGQTTPVSVTAVVPAVLERANIQRPSSLSRIVAGLVTQPNTAFDAGFSAFIRGIGSSESALTLDTPVGVYRDGVYLGKATVAGNTDITSLERVEVLRGPQGTLFGRNTTGGAINFVTRSPRDEFGVSQRLRYGRFSEIESITTVDTGQFGGLSAMATYQHRQRHGYVDDPNANSRHDPGAVNADTFFGKVRGEWGGFTATYVFDYYKAGTVSPLYQLTAGNANFLAYYGASPSLGGSALPISASRLAEVNIVNQPLQHNKTQGHALTLEYRIDDRLTLKSITGYRKYDAPELYFTITPEGLRGRLVTAPTLVQPVGLYITNPKYQHQEQFTQEVQALGDIGPVSYTVGAFHFRETGDEFNRGTLVAVISPTHGFPTTTTSSYYIHNNSDALYGQLSYKPEFLEGF